MPEENFKKFALPVDDVGGLPAELAFLSSLKRAEAEEQNEGQLAVDVAETNDELVVLATMAGAPKESVELHLYNDLLTIKGERRPPLSAEVEHHYQECYWGKFSRSIVLPADVRPDLAQAEYKNGLLIVRLPKARSNQDIPITVVEE